MKKTILFASVILLLFGSCQEKAATDTGKFEAKIKLATDYLLSQEGPGENAKEGLKLLVEAIEMASAEAEFPSDFREKISEARRLFESNSIFEQKGVVLLMESYLIANAGEEFCMPEAITSVQQAAEYARQLIGSSQRNLKQGNIGECAKGLLEVALVVVTPIIQQIQ